MSLKTKFPMILKAFFDRDVLSEEAIVQWHSGRSVKHLDRETQKFFKEKSSPFVEWLTYVLAIHIVHVSKLSLSRCIPPPLLPIYHETRLETTFRNCKIPPLYSSIFCFSPITPSLSRAKAKSGCCLLLSFFFFIQLLLY